MARRRDGVDAARRAEGATGGASTRTGKIHHPWFRMRSCRDFGASTKRAMWLAMAGFSASRRVWAEPFENRTGHAWAHLPRVNPSVYAVYTSRLD